MTKGKLHIELIEEKMSRVHKLSDITAQQFAARTASAPTGRLLIAAQTWKL